MPVKVGCAAGSESLCQLDVPELSVAVGPDWAVGVKPGAGQAGGEVAGSWRGAKVAPAPAPARDAAAAAAAAAHGSAPIVDQGSEDGTVPAVWYRGSAPAADQTSGGGTVPAWYGCICGSACCG